MALDMADSPFTLNALAESCVPQVGGNLGLELPVFGYEGDKTLVVQVGAAGRETMNIKVQ
jgi:hypothetical protein